MTRRGLDALYDEDGIDAPWEALMDAPLDGERFREVRTDGVVRVLEVLYTWRDAGRDLVRARCRVVEDSRLDEGRGQTTVSVRRLTSPAFFERVRRARRA